MGSLLEVGHKAEKNVTVINLKVTTRKKSFTFPCFFAFFMLEKFPSVCSVCILWMASRQFDNKIFLERMLKTSES